jgi:hypothetical protein
MHYTSFDNPITTGNDDIDWWLAANPIHSCHIKHRNDCVRISFGTPASVGA